MSRPSSSAIVRSVTMRFSRATRSGASFTDKLFVTVHLAYAPTTALLLAHPAFPDTIFANHFPAEPAPLLVALLNVLVTDVTTADYNRRLFCVCKSVHFTPRFLP